MAVAGEDGLKRCSKCGERKDPSQFGKHPAAKDGLQTACRDCYAAYQRERRKNPRLKAEDRARINRAMAKRQDYYNTLHNTARQRRRQDPEYRAKELSDRRATRDVGRENHARRARKLAAQVSGPVPAGIYAAILANNSCVYCGAPADTVDHITPLSRSGHEAEYNLVPACTSCNSSKGPKLLAEWNQARVTQALACSPKVCAQFHFQRPQLTPEQAPSWRRTTP